MKLEVAAVTSH